MNATTPSAPLLAVHELRVHFPVRAGIFRREIGVARTVDGVDFAIASGESVGLAGEGGCGKSTLGRALLNLAQGDVRATGSVRFDGREILNLTDDAFRLLRKEMQMVFPDPYASPNPRQRVAEIIGEAYDAHFPRYGESERLGRTVALLERVGLSGDCLWRFPFEFSGGQRRRLGLARALAVEPSLIVCDDPVGELDASARSPIIDLLHDLREEYGHAYLILARDPVPFGHAIDRLLVMSRGKVSPSACGRLPEAHPAPEAARKESASAPALP